MSLALLLVLAVHSAAAGTILGDKDTSHDGKMLSSAQPSILKSLPKQTVVPTERGQTEKSVLVEPVSAKGIQDEEVPKVEGPTEKKIQGFIKELEDLCLRYDLDLHKWIVLSVFINPDHDGNDVNDGNEDGFARLAYRHFGGGGFAGFGGGRNYGGFGGRGFGGRGFGGRGFGGRGFGGGFGRGFGGGGFGRGGEGFYG